MALVIGNARYADASLVNPANDAWLVASTLKKLGFVAPTVLIDVGKADLLEQVRQWFEASAQAGVRVLYFAGHGAQYRGRNYLIPSGVRLHSEDDLPRDGVSVDSLADSFSRLVQGVNVMVLDACRSRPGLNLPPGSRTRDAGRAASWSSGFSAASAPRGTLIACSTSPGSLADDSPAAKNGLYARHFVTHLATPGIPIETVFKRTRAAVLQESGGAQLPWETSSLIGDFHMVPASEGRTCDKA